MYLLLLSPVLPACFLAAASASPLLSASDTVLAVACTAISILLLYLAASKPDLPFRSAFVLAALFLLASGAMHLLAAVGADSLEPAVKFLAALLAVIALFALVPVPKKALSLRSPMEVERAQRLIEEQIAERRQAEERLVMAAGFPNENPHPLLETDLAGQPTYMNPAAEAQFPDLQELGAEHPVLDGLAPMVRSFRWGEQESITRQVAHGASVFQQKICYLEKRDHLLIYMVDITDLDQAQAALRKSEEELRALFDQAPVAYLEYDTEGAVWRVNQALCTLLGYASAEIVGKPVWQFVAADQRDACREYMLGRTSGRELLVPYAVECIRKDRVRVVLEVHENFVRSQQGMIVGLRCVLHDVTETQHQQAEMRQAKTAAEESARSRSEFAAILAAQMRASVGEILAKSDRALRSGLTPDQGKQVAAIKLSVAALLSLVSDVRDFSELEAGTLRFEPVDFSLREAVGEVVTALAPLAREKGLEVAYRVGHDVPDRLIGDLSRLRQLLLRLAGNAVQFTEQGEVVVDVETGTQMRKGEVGLHFRVADSGIGIARENQPRIFEAFRHPVGPVLRQRGGAGLGLAISSRLAERMGGRLWVDSEPKKGSVFHFTLMLRCSEQPSEGAPPRLRELERQSVLLASHQLATRRILAEMLEIWRMKVRIANDAEAALADMRDAAERGEPFQLALLDAHLPGAEGLELARQIWKIPQLGGPKLIMLVEEGRPQDEAYYLESGVDDCLTKPVRYHRLWSAVAAAFGKHLPAVTPVRPIESPAPLADPSALSSEGAQERAARADRMAARIMAAARTAKPAAR